MVSKSKELGLPTLILVSVGSTKFPFSRLTSAVDKLDKDQYKIFDKFISPDQFIDKIKKADRIIVHGGPVTVFLVVKYAKFMPLIIPRLAKYKEHVDDHQLFFVRYLKNIVPQRLKRFFVTEEKIDVVIGNYLKESGKVNKLSDLLFLDKKGYLANKLSSYISFSFPQ